MLSADEQLNRLLAVDEHWSVLEELVQKPIPGLIEAASARLSKATGQAIAVFAGPSIKNLDCP